MAERNYIFSSQRIGFRNWLSSDIEPMAAINADPEVMEFFPSTQTLEKTEKFVTRMQNEFEESGYCYFAVDLLSTNEFIGFIGISYQTFKSIFTPCIDIGWRLSQGHWGKGLATEGAKRCLEFAFVDLELDSIKSIAPVINVKSEQVMKKIGMEKIQSFKHPLLEENTRLEDCNLYEIKASSFLDDN